MTRLAVITPHGESPDEVSPPHELSEEFSHTPHFSLLSYPNSRWGVTNPEAPASRLLACLEAGAAQKQQPAQADRAVEGLGSRLSR